MARFLSVFLLLFPVLGSTKMDCSLIEKEVEFTLIPESELYRLPDSLVLLGSEVIEIDGNRIDASLYKIDYNSGLIELPDSTSGRMKVHYQIFPFSIRKEYYHRKRVIDSTREPIIHVAENRQTDKSQSGGVRIGGKKTFSISVGSKDELTFNQTLELKLGGEISGIAVNGILSDKNSDLSEPSTKNIEELDDMYMEVEGDQFKCRIGDNDLIIDGNRFCNLDRKLDGVMGSLSLSGLDMMAIGAITRRKFATNSFAGEDEKQGPYQLRNSNGTECFNVVRGSEKVYLDGEHLERGGDKDYTMDYELGTIEFTPRRLITSESRIVVDFQYSTDEFQKEVYGAKVSTRFPDRKLSIAASGFTERDDIESSLHSSIDEKMKEEISRVGSDTDEVWIDGGELVGEGAGDYLKLDDHYEYVGTNSGSYKVSFTCVGEGKGDYAYSQEKGGYEWVGEGNGNYVASMCYPLPQSKSLYDLKLTYYPISDLSIEYEQAFSKKDLNNYSALDEVRHSEAHSIELSLKEKPLGWGELTLCSRFWKMGRGFTLSSRVTEVGKWYDRSNLMGCRAEEAEVVYSLPLLKMGVSLGNMYSPEGEAFRREFATTLNPDGSPHAFLNYEKTEHRDEGGFRFSNRKTIGFGHELGYLSPSLLYSEEFKNLEKSRRYGFLLDLVKIDFLSGRYEHTTIDHDKEESTANWKPESKEERDILTLFLKARHTNAEFNYTHRNKRYQQLPGENIDYSLVSLFLSSTPLRDRMEFTLNSILTSKKLQKKEIIYTEVDEGEGDYVKDPQSGEYYLYDSGDYIRELVWTGDSEPTLGLKAEFQSRLRPSGTITLSSRLLLDKEVRKREKLFTLWSGKKLKNLLDNTIEITSRNKKVSFRVNHKWCRSFEQSGEEQIEERRALTAVLNGGKVGVVVRGSEELSKSNFAAYIRREEKKRRIEATEIFKFTPFTFSLLEGVETKKVCLPYHYQSLGLIELNTIFVGPSSRFEIPFKGSVESRVEFSLSTSPQETMPYILTLTDPLGWRYQWINILNYWLTRSMSSTFVYQGEKGGGDTDHKFKVEIRGYF